MPPAVLIIGANGSIGSATLRASLSRAYPTYAFLRTPSKLPSDLSSHPSLTVIQGDALDSSSVRRAVGRKTPPIDAVVLAAPYGDMRGRRSGYEQIAGNVVRAVQEEQKESGRKIKLWIMAGAAVLDHPELPGTYMADVMPMTFYPEYPRVIQLLNDTAQDVHWTMNCPALIKTGQPAGPLVESITIAPMFRGPYWFTRLLPFNIGYGVNNMYNWVTQRVTFQSLGEYMIANLSLDERLRGKRVGVLEDPKGMGK